MNPLETADVRLLEVALMTAQPPGLSLCMIVRNEERFLDAALRSVRGVVDEICIVDTGSSDATLAIARSHGARIREVPWTDDFSAARNAALALARRRWILVLDADERLDCGSRAELRTIGTRRAAGRGCWITCRNLIAADEASGATSNALVRIFPNDPRIRYRNAIHEFVAVDGHDGGLAADRTNVTIVHHGYIGAVVLERRKGERNLRLSRSAAEREPHDPFHQYNLGMAALLAGEPQAAIAALDRMRELTRLAPRGFRVHGLIVLAQLYAESRADHATATELVVECLRHVPNYSDAHFMHGKILAAAGELYAARDAFGRAIAAGADNAEQFVVDDEIAVWKAHNEIAATLMREGRFAEALQWLELAAQARPHSPALALNRAKCCEALGDLTNAGDLYAAAFGWAPGEPAAIELINFLLRYDRRTAAFEALEAALVVVDPARRPLLLGVAAAAHLRAGAQDLARVALERAHAQGADGAQQTIAALAAHLGLPELERLSLQCLPGRARGLRIAYVG